VYDFGLGFKRYPQYKCGFENLWQWPCIFIYKFAYWTLSGRFSFSGVPNVYAMVRKFDLYPWTFEAGGVHPLNQGFSACGWPVRFMRPAKGLWEIVTSRQKTFIWHWLALWGIYCGLMKKPKTRTNDRYMPRLHHTSPYPFISHGRLPISFEAILKLREKNCS
jgi:hypothetical protein